MEDDKYITLNCQELKGVIPGSNVASSIVCRTLRGDTLITKAPKVISDLSLSRQFYVPLLQRNFTSLQPHVTPSVHSICLLPQNLPQIATQRSLTKFSLQSGKRKSVKAVLKRFYRLEWGMWIRGKCGRNKKLYKKSFNRKRRLRQHVFTNATQSWLLDKMVTRFWRKPKYYIEDPYRPYHLREEFPLTRRKPVFPQ